VRLSENRSYNQLKSSYLLSSGGLGDINTAVRISSNIDSHDLVPIIANAKGQVGVQVYPGALDRLSQQEFLMYHFTHVRPHRQVIHEHFKKIIIFDGVLQLLDLNKKI